MDERLKRLIARREAATKERERLQNARRAITEQAEQESRDDLSEEEDTEFRSLLAKGKEQDELIASFDERITELSEEITRDQKISQGAAAVRRAQAAVTSVSESATYEKGNTQRSYLRDLVRTGLRMDGDGGSAERLQRHAVDVETLPEYRALLRTDGNGGYFVPPAWLVDQGVELARAGRPTANLVTSQVLPGGTDSINIPAVLTGTATAIQATDNASVTSTDLTDSSITAPVRTITGQQDIAIQLLDQSPINFDEVIFRDLLGDYATKLNVQVLNGAGSSGTLKGIFNATGLNSVTYTDATPTVGELYPKGADAIQQIHTGRFRAPSVVVMHPRRWAWMLAALDSQGRPLVTPAGPGFNQIGTLDAVASQQVVGTWHGLPVVTDPSVPTNFGTNEDRIIVMKADDCLLWESSVRSRVLPDVGSGTLTVRLQVYGYSAFTAERYPKGISVVSGTGLILPTF